MLFIMLPILLITTFLQTITLDAAAVRYDSGDLSLDATPQGCCLARALEGGPFTSVKTLLGEKGWVTYKRLIGSYNIDFLSSGYCIGGMKHPCYNFRDDPDTCKRIYDLLQNKLNVRIIINLTEDSLPEKVHEWAPEISFYHIPILTDNPPSIKQLIMMFKLINTLSKGERLVVHCNGGVGRTGTVLAALQYLRLYDSAVSVVSSEEQVDFMRKIINYMRERRGQIDPRQETFLLNLADNIAKMEQVISRPIEEHLQALSYENPDLEPETNHSPVTPKSVTGSEMYVPVHSERGCCIIS